MRALLVRSSLPFPLAVPPPPPTIRPASNPAAGGLREVALPIEVLYDSGSGAPIWNVPPDIVSVPVAPPVPSRPMETRLAPVPDAVVPFDATLRWKSTLTAPAVWLKVADPLL